MIAIRLVVLDVTLAFPSMASAQSGGWILCADEGLWCEWHGKKAVRYGVGGRYVVRRIGGSGFMCENKRFGDPAPGKKKFCWIRQL